MLRSTRSNKVYLVRFPKDHACDAKEHRWPKFALGHAANSKCPECCGPGRGDLKSWVILYGKEGFYVDCSSTPYRHSKI